MTETADLMAKVGVLRALALHGPMPTTLLMSWHIDGVSEESQRVAVERLIVGGEIRVTPDGRLDLRGVDRARWATMSDAEKHARAEAIESAAKLAHVAYQMHAAARERRPLDAVRLMGEMVAEGARGLVAAKKADAAKGEP